MSSLTDYAENKLIDFLFRGQALGLAGSSAAAGTGPATYYFGLLTANPTDGSAGTEVTGGSYARVAVNTGTANFGNTQDSGTGASSGTSGTTKNLAAITFPAPTANWGTVTGVGVYDASSAGNLIYWAAQTPNKTINNGDPAPSIAIGAHTFQIDN
jgi:hypothetical protein